MAIMIMLKNRKRNESTRKSCQQFIPSSESLLLIACAIRGRIRKTAERRLLTEYKLLGGR
jgi:hypothetical protein